MATRIYCFQCRVNGKIIDGRAEIDDILAERLRHIRRG